MKRLLCLLCLFVLISTACYAEIIPAGNIDTSFYEWTGIETTPAVILCESLSVYNQRENGKKVDTLLGSGGKATIPVIEYWDGWAKIYYQDGKKTGWVRSDYLLMNPACYVTDEATSVYAYMDDMAPKIALVEKGEKLPIIYDAGEWVVVSIRNAAGWIKKTAKDTENQTWFRPEMINNTVNAILDTGKQVYYLSDPEKINQLIALLTNTEDLGGTRAGCPFTASLYLTLDTNEKIVLEIATDSCCVYRVDERDYKYARHLYNPEVGGLDNSCLLELFGITEPLYQ